VALALGLTVLVVLPWYVPLHHSFGLWRVTGQWLKMAPADYHPILSPLRLPWQLVSIRTLWGGPRALDVLNGAMLLIVLVLALRRMGGRLFSPRRRLLWFAAAAAVGTPIVLDLALGTYMSMVPRYALAALPPALVLVAVTLLALAPRRRVLVTALLVVLELAGAWRGQRNRTRSGEPFTQLAAFLSHARVSDVIIVHSIPSGVCGVARYLVRQGGLEDAPLLSWVGQLRRPEEPTDIETLAHGRHRVLLVEIHTVGDQLPWAAWLETGARLVSTHRFETATVHVFETRKDEPFTLR
jgi:hypothetical protein